VRSPPIVFGLNQPIALRDPVSNYYTMTLDQANALTPHLSWTAFLKEQGAPVVPAVDVNQPTFYRALDGLIHGLLTAGTFGWLWPR
jgi:putative endopeptidase